MLDVLYRFLILLFVQAPPIIVFSSAVLYWQGLDLVFGSSYSMVSMVRKERIAIDCQKSTLEEVLTSYY